MLIIVFLSAYLALCSGNFKARSLISLIDGTARPRLPIIEKCVSDVEMQPSASLLSFPGLWGALDGDWELIYTNNGPIAPKSVTPSLSKLKNVIQRINSIDQTVEHILSFDGLFQGDIILKHNAQVTSDSCPALLSIVLNGISAKGPLGSIDLPLNKLFGFDDFRKGFFEVRFYPFI